ncbi:hypothetical protein XELAEV_18000585mg [Xenopus laevis]|nr:hypothetical protein XELAEV_18000585mg [Xenopus laevis]
MESSHHRLSVHSYQDTFNLISNEKLKKDCHSLSKSVSTVSDGQGPEQKRHDIHKSLNRLFCQSTSSDNRQASQTEKWSTMEDPVLDSYFAEDLSNHFINHPGENGQLQNNYIAADSFPNPREPEGYSKSDVLENMSLLGGSKISKCKAQRFDRFDTQEVGIKKSYSDSFYNKVPISSSPMISNKNSATYLTLYSSTGISDAASDSGIVGSLSNNQNNLSEMMCSGRDQNIGLFHLGSHDIKQNISLHSVTETYHHRVLEPMNSENGFANNSLVYSQPHCNKPGLTVCDSFCNMKQSQINNSCEYNCRIAHKPAMKGDDTIAAFCHSLPIPSVQYSPGLLSILGESGPSHTHPEFCSLLPPSGNFVFPKLVSSVSESGLDAKKLMRCGKLFFTQSAMSIGEMQLSRQGSYELLTKLSETSSITQQATGLSKEMKDTWTMTTENQLSKQYRHPLHCKDAEVQTIVIMENKSVSTTPYIPNGSHAQLFPEVGLALQCPRSPVREVCWDDEGMTWEVYGAAMDPEVLGFTIQKHLDIQIEHHLQPSEKSRDTTVNQSANEKRRLFRNVMHSLRQSNCCMCTNSTVE